MTRILLLEPYFGGSHKAWLKGIMSHIEADYTLMTLPPRKWKMRMQLAAHWCVDQLCSRDVTERCFDVVLCSSLIDVAVLRSLVQQIDGWHAEARILTYFHENQFVYPQQVVDPGIHQFAAINFNSAMASDGIGFNSEYNRRTFLGGCHSYLKKAGEMKLTGVRQELEAKSQVLYPAMDFRSLDRLMWQKNRRAVHIVWNHRWEHDKNPEEFFQAMMELAGKGIDFRLIILGQSFADIPTCFLEGCQALEDRLVHCGYLEEYGEYIAMLGQGDIVVSTANHEFFGIAIIEAVRAGCIPVVPDRLSYPELFGRERCYREGELVSTLEELIRHCPSPSREQAVALTQRFSWDVLHDQYRHWLLGCRRTSCHTEKYGAPPGRMGHPD